MSPAVENPMRMLVGIEGSRTPMTSFAIRNIVGEIDCLPVVTVFTFAKGDLQKNIRKNTKMGNIWKFYYFSTGRTVNS